MIFAEDELSDDDFLCGRLRLLQPLKGYRAATDPVLLASPTYQLSPAGRAELREQLRREQRENRGMRP